MIFTRYLIKNILQSFSLTTLVLLVILTSNLMVRLLTNIQEDGLYSGYLLPLIFFNLLNDLPLLLPICLLIGIILAFNKMHRNSEIIAMQALGVSFKDFAKSVLIVSLPVFVFVAGLALYISPVSLILSDQYRYESNIGNQLKSLINKNFTLSPDKKNVIYVNENNTVLAESNLNKKINWPMRGIFIHSKLANKQERIIIAKKAKQIVKSTKRGNVRYLVLADGEVYTFKNDNLVKLMSYKRYEMALGIQTKNYNQFQSYATISTQDLLSSNNKRYKAEFYWRLGTPFTLLIAGFLALSLCSFKPRDYSLNKLFIGMFIYIAYHTILFNAHRWAIDSFLPVWFLFLLIHLLMIFLIIISFAYQRGYLKELFNFSNSSNILVSSKAKENKL